MNKSADLAEGGQLKFEGAHGRNEAKQSTLKTAKAH